MLKNESVCKICANKNMRLKYKYSEQFIILNHIYIYIYP